MFNLRDQTEYLIINHLSLAGVSGGYLNLPTGIFFGFGPIWALVVFQYIEVVLLKNYSFVMQIILFA